jgi:hypothetical protein
VMAPVSEVSKRSPGPRPRCEPSCRESLRATRVVRSRQVGLYTIPRTCLPPSGHESESEQPWSDFTGWRSKKELGTSDQH